MKSIRAFVALFLLAAFLAGTAYANTSSINPNVPAQNSPLSSAVLRGNFANAQSDINTIFNILGLSSNQLLGTTSAGNAGPLNIPSCSTGALSWTPGSGLGCNSISGISSPVTIPLVFTGTAHTIDLNATSLPTKETGTVVQFGNADTIVSRMEGDGFGAAVHYTGQRADGTNASPTALQANDEINSLNSFGYNGTAYTTTPSASVSEYAAANWTTSSNSTYVSIKTTPANSTTMAEVARFNSDGGLTLPATVTGGDMGPGTGNFAHVYRQGVELAPSAGALVEIGGGPQVASSSASLSWTGLGTTYNTYLVDRSNIILSTGSNNLLIQIGEGGGPTWKTTGYIYNGIYTTSAGSSTFVSNNASGSGFLLNYNADISTAGPFGARAYVSNLSTASFKTYSSASTYWASSSQTIAGSSGGGYSADSGVGTALRVIPSSGTITSGQCSAYALMP